MKTWKNKLSAIVLLACGYVGVLLENDATALVFLGMFAVPLFSQKKIGCIEDGAANNGSFFFAKITTPVMEINVNLKGVKGVWTK